MPKERVAVYIDGFNLYHAIDNLEKPYLKWLNVRKLANLLIRPRDQRIVSIKYFSALANHYSGTNKVHRLIRHRAYVNAIRAKGVEVHLGNFAKRDMRFKAPHYQAKWRRFEEKQTDVGIAVNLINDAHCDIFDTALVISLDTDMLPAFAIMRNSFPNKRIICVAPPSRAHHREIQNAGVELAAIRETQLQRALFGRRVVSNGQTIATRPRAYDPPI